MILNVIKYNFIDIFDIIGFNLKNLYIKEMIYRSYNINKLILLIIVLIIINLFIYVVIGCFTDYYFINFNFILIIKFKIIKYFKVNYFIDLHIFNIIIHK